jgi:cbb3-type cytochrome oxidase maturation protein
VSILYLLVPLATLLAGIAAYAFVWSARRGQLDDLVTPALRMLHDDEPVAPEPTTVAPIAESRGGARQSNRVRHDEG